tara:strand:+ start:376 stop:579 length:204 start_codon:yes stop_codon:yes gene_type:complete
MPTKIKRSKKRTKAQLHDAIGESLHAASIRLDMLKHSGNKTQQAQAEAACRDVRKAHSSFKELIGKR